MFRRYDIFSSNSNDVLYQERFFVQNSLMKQGFYPKNANVLAFRGDGRNPDEIIKAGGFFRWDFGKREAQPSIRADGGVRNMVGVTTDLNIAIGFAKFSVNAQRKESDELMSGWVYAFYLPKGTFFDPRDYPYAFLGEWGQELDTDFIPLCNIIAAIKVSAPKGGCIHRYLEEVPDSIHQHYCDQDCPSCFNVSVTDFWKNDRLSLSKAAQHLGVESLAQYFDDLSKCGIYAVQHKGLESDYSRSVADKFYLHKQICSLFSKKERELTVKLNKDGTFSVFNPDNLNNSVRFPFSSDASLMKPNFSLFRRVKNNYIERNRHFDQNLQREYDKSFGLVRKSGGISLFSG